VRGVTGQEHAPLAHLVRDQPSPDPVLDTQGVVDEILSHAQDRPDRGIAVDRVEIRLVGPEIVVHQEAVVVVDRIDRH